MRDDRWIILFSRNRDELEKFIRLLIADTVVRKKFSGEFNDKYPSEDIEGFLCRLDY